MVALATQQTEQGWCEGGTKASRWAVTWRRDQRG